MNFLAALSRDAFIDTTTYKSRLTQKKMYKNTDAIFSIYGKTGLSHDIFFKSSVEPFEVIEVE